MRSACTRTDGEGGGTLGLMFRILFYRIKNLFVGNPRCCQPGYCRTYCPEDYARPDHCKDCDK